MASNETSLISLHEDGTARYERTRQIPNPNGGEPRSLIVEDKQVDARILMPNQGSLTLLPAKCRFSRTEHDRTVFVIEDEPTTRTIHWDIHKDSDCNEMIARILNSGVHHLWGEPIDALHTRLRTQRSFQLRFPYVLRFYLFCQRRLVLTSLWYRPKPLTSDRDALYVPNLPNLNNKNGQLCGTDYMKDGRSYDSFSEAVAQLETELWGSRWNGDWSAEFHAYARRIPELASPWEWERTSRFDPLFLTRVDWRHAERTVREEVGTLLSGTSSFLSFNPKDTFRSFERILKGADPWDAKVRSTSADFLISPAERIWLHDLSLTIGDTLMILDKIPGSTVQPDQTYQIEWFGRPDEDQTRYVKLVGVKDSLPLIYRASLRYSKRVVTETQVTSDCIMINDQPLTVGCLIRFTSRQSWPGRDDRFYVIEQTRLGARGTIQVKLVREETFIVIGQMQQLYPDIELRPPEKLQNQHQLAATTLDLADGTKLSVGDTIYYRTDGQDLRVDTIAHFKPLAHCFHQNMMLASGTLLECSNAQSQRSERILWVGREPQLPASVHIDGKILRVGSMISSSRWSSPRKILKLTPLLPDGYYAVFEDGRCTRITDGDRAILPNFSLVKRLRILANGQRCRLSGTSYHTGRPFYDTQTNQLVTFDKFIEETGFIKARIPLFKETAIFIENYVRVERFIPVQLRAHVRTGLLLEQGMNLRLRVAVGEYPAQSLFTLSHLQRLSKLKSDLAAVTTTGLVIPLSAHLLEMKKGRRWVPVLGDKPARPCTLKTIQLPDKAFEELQRRCTAPIGTLTDSYNSKDGPIRIGDRLRVLDDYYLNEASSAAGRKAVTSRTGGHVVYSSDYILYLDSGVENATVATKETPFNRSELSGYKQIPVSRRKDPAWWSRLVFLYCCPGDCLQILTPTHSRNKTNSTKGTAKKRTRS